MEKRFFSFKTILTLASVAIVPLFAAADDASVQVSDAWVRPAVKTKATALYMHIKNNSAKEDVLLSANCPVAKNTSIHKSVEEANLAKMVKLDKLAIPASSSVDAAPGGIHLMLNDLAQDLEVDKEVTCVLKFEKAGDVNLVAKVTNKVESDKPVSDKSMDGKHSMDKTMESKPAMDKAMESKPAMDKAMENKPAMDKAVDGKHADEKSPEASH